MKTRYNNTPLSYVELYPQALEQEQPPSPLAMVLGVILCSAMVFVSLVFAFSI
jgi:hypothetical protein